MFPNQQKYYRIKKKIVHSIDEELLLNTLYTIPKYPGMYQAIQG